MLPSYASTPERLWYYAHRALCAVILVFLVVPILVIIPLSFNSDSFLMYPMAGFSMRWYEEFFHSATWQLALKNSLIVDRKSVV